MIEIEETRTSKRILVAIDTSVQSMAAVQEGAAMASRSGAELYGVFIEDINLIRVAALPCTRELTSRSARDLDINHVRLERIFRCQAKQAEKALQDAAQEFQVQTSFRVARGQVVSILLEASETTDVVVLGKNSLMKGDNIKDFLLKRGRQVIVVG